MRRIPRSNRSIDLLQAGLPPCSLPSSRAALSTSQLRLVRQPRSAESTKVPFTERIRQRIWGTNTPPGQEDPYGNQSKFDRTKQRQAEIQEEEAAETQAVKREASDTAYQPANTWDGLESVGGFGGWWKDNWDPEHSFKGFKHSTRITSREAITAALHRAVVEVFTLHQAGRTLTDVCNARDDKIIAPTAGVIISPRTEGLGDVTLTYPDMHVKDAILESTVASEPVAEVLEAEREVEKAEEAEELDSLEQSEIRTPTTDLSTTLAANEPVPLIDLYEEIPAGDQRWLSISLLDMNIRFARPLTPTPTQKVLKRTTQLTGFHIPDPIIHSLTTVSSLLSTLTIPVKPKKLTQVLSANEQLIGLSNVKVFDRRITPIDKEKTMGRWKVIEKELERRGLPVMGRGRLRA
ncbi:MAG: hypothetical protein M1827_005797 [Pycnora praestabilis]|nr:MAG: hypothetical protein M1827_005797 [Pycnora praestabilis]